MKTILTEEWVQIPDGGTSSSPLISNSYCEREGQKGQGKGT